LLAATAGLLQSCDLDNLHLRGDHVEDFADVLADETQFAATRRAAGAGVEFPALARCLFRYTRPATHYSLRTVCYSRDWRCLISLIDRSGIALGCSDQKILQRQFQLLDFALNLF